MQTTQQKNKHDKTNKIKPETTLWEEHDGWKKQKYTVHNAYLVVPLVFIATTSKRKIPFVGKGGHERDVQSPSFGSTSAMEKKLMHKDLHMIAPMLGHTSETWL